MKEYEITLGDGRVFIMPGEILTVCEATGQSFIYSEKDTTWHNLVAVIPVNAFIRVLKKPFNFGESWVEFETN